MKIKKTLFISTHVLHFQKQLDASIEKLKMENEEFELIDVKFQNSTSSEYVMALIIYEFSDHSRLIPKQPSSTNEESPFSKEFQKLT